MPLDTLPGVIALLEKGDARGARNRLLTQPLHNAEQDFLLGVCAHLLDEIPVALEHFTATLKQDALHTRAAAALSSLYGGLGHRAQAEQLLRQTLARIEDPQLRFNLAVILEQGQNIDEALAEYCRVLEQHPNHYGARHNRAGLLTRLMRLHEAAADYRELIKRHPNSTLPWQNLADLNISFSRYDEAITLLTEVKKREPGNAKAVQSMAIAYAAAGNFVESRAAFELLGQLDPILWEAARQRVDTPHEHSTHIDPRLIFLVRQHEHLEACQWRDWELCCRVWHEYLRNPGSGNLLPLSYRAFVVPTTSQEQLQLSQAIARQCSISISAAGITPQQWPVSPAPARLRVAYISRDFGRHATGVVVRQFFAAHDPDQIEIILITLSPSDGSEIAQEIYASAQQVLDISTLDDANACAAINALNLDILVDFNGYTSGSRPQLMAARLARIQLHWLIHACSTGSAAIDYYIGDPHVVPDTHWCSEALVLLPESYFVFSHSPEPPLIPTRSSLGLPENCFIFCCLNAPQKIDPETFSLWMEILKETPNSVLWLLGGNAATIMNLQREATWREIDPARLLFAPKTNQQTHLARMGAADLFLDTRYFNAHTTAAEALWAGLPVLTCPGETFASRVGKSLLLSCDLPELVANDWAHYKEIALRAAQDTSWLAGLREHLMISRHQAAIFDVKKQAGNIEKAYRHMRERFAQDLAPKAFNVVDLH